MVKSSSLIQAKDTDDMSLPPKLSLYPNFLQSLSHMNLDPLQQSHPGTPYFLIELWLSTVPSLFEPSSLVTFFFLLPTSSQNLQ